MSYTCIPGRHTFEDRRDFFVIHVSETSGFQIERREIMKMELYIIMELVGRMYKPVECVNYSLAKRVITKEYSAYFVGTP